MLTPEDRVMYETQAPESNVRRCPTELKRESPAWRGSRRQRGSLGLMERILTCL